MENRLKSIVRSLNEQQLDMAFLQTKENVFYLSKFYSEPHERLLAIVIFRDHEPILICPQMEQAQAKRAGWGSTIISYNDSENPWTLLEEYFNKNQISIQNCAIEEEAISYARAHRLREIFPNLTFKAVDPIMNYLRLVKDEQEIRILKEAAKLADFGVEVGVNAISKGKTEMEILALIEYELKRKGIREMSFSTMVLTGENSADPHGKPGLTEIQKGDFVLFDLGVVLDGYCSDITRTVAYKQLSVEKQKIYHTVLEAQLTALTHCQKGMRIGDIDLAARNYISEKGYGDYFPHRIGHGLGISVHEYPSMNDKNDQLLPVGAVFTIEPGIYVPKVGGVRIEDEVVITEDGYELLTKYPKELQIVK